MLLLHTFLHVNQDAVLYIIKPPVKYTSTMDENKGFETFMLIYTALCAVMIFRACGEPPKFAVPVSGSPYVLGYKKGTFVYQKFLYIGGEIGI